MPASILAYKERERINRLRSLGLYKSGYDEIDEVLLGGFERGSIVGISSEDEDQFGLQVCK